MLKTIRASLACITLLAFSLTQAQPALNPAVTQASASATICKGGYTKTIRPAHADIKAIKREAMLLAGQASSPPSAYQMHRIIPMELGGSPLDPSNLELRPISFEKSPDGILLREIGSELKRQACSGQLSLSEAQNEMLRRWSEVRRSASHGS